MSLAIHETGAIYATSGDEWFGPAVWASRDLGATWTHESWAGLRRGANADQNRLEPRRRAPARLPGVEPAGLFVSEDSGASWAHLDGLQKHPTRPDWTPGGAGLNLHAIVTHPDDPNQLWIGISSVGVFHTVDGGATWTTRNSGVRTDYFPEGMRYAEFGQCVHGLVMAPGLPNRLYQQNHCGMYRSDDGGASWQSIEEGLPFQLRLSRRGASARP